MKRSPPAQKVRGQRKTLRKERRRWWEQEENISCLCITERRTRTSLWCKTGDSLVALTVTSAVTNNQPGLTPSLTLAQTSAVDDTERDHSDKQSQDE